MKYARTILTLLFTVGSIVLMGREENNLSFNDRDHPLQEKEAFTDGRVNDWDVDGPGATGQGEYSSFHPYYFDF